MSKEVCKNNDDIGIVVCCAFAAHYTSIINDEFDII